MVSQGSLLTAEFEDERLRLTAGGAWTASHAGELERLVDSVASDASKAKTVSIDMRGVREFDTYKPSARGVSMSTTYVELNREGPSEPSETSETSEPGEPGEPGENVPSAWSRVRSQSKRRSLAGTYGIAVVVTITVV